MMGRGNDMETVYQFRENQKAGKAADTVYHLKKEPENETVTDRQPLYLCPVTIHLNARFQPKHRFELEDVLQDVLEQKKLGTVDGGGTLQSATGEIMSCDIEVMLKDTNQDTMSALCGILNRFGIPKGSQLIFTGQKTEIGLQEGLAIYLNGTDLPKEVYRTCDINYVIDRIDQLLADTGRMYSYWEGQKETALYYYGESCEKMLARIQPFLDTYPLLAKCRVSRIS